MMVTEKKRRNRSRSKRRPIFCPVHGCYLDSVSAKHPMFAHQVEHLREAGFGRNISLLLLQEYSTVSLTGHWLEKFWCEDCNQTEWYRVERYHVDNQGAAKYHIAVAERHLWERVSGVHHPEGNPSVGEFTRKQAKARSMVRDFGAVS
jgi:hypothetical protein